MLQIAQDIGSVILHHLVLNRVFNEQNYNEIISFHERANFPVTKMQILHQHNYLGSESSWRFQLTFQSTDFMDPCAFASTKIIIKLKEDEKVVENSFIIAEDHGNFCINGHDTWRSNNILGNPVYQQSDHTLSVYLSFEPQNADSTIRFGIKLHNVALGSS